MSFPEMNGELLRIGALPSFRSFRASSGLCYGDRWECYLARKWDYSEACSLY